MYYYLAGFLKCIILIAAISILSFRSLSQEYIDLFKSDYSISPGNVFDSTNYETDLHELNGDFTLPVKINDRFALLTGVTYEKLSASLTPDQRSQSVTGITLKLGANIKHNSKWSGTYLVLPKISSDLKSISSRDFQVGGVVLMKYTKSSQFNYKFGVYANSELFGAFVVPILGFYYQDPSEKFEAKVLLPLSVDLNYSFTKTFRCGLNFKGQVRTYNLNEQINAEDNRYLARSTNELLGYMQYSHKSGVNLQLGVGHSAGRSFRVYEDKVAMGMPLIYFNDNRQQINSDFADGFLFKASVFYRLDLGSDR